MASIALPKAHRKNSETTDCTDCADGKDKIIRNVQVQSWTIEPARGRTCVFFPYPV